MGAIAIALMSCSAFAGPNDSGVPLVDGLINGADTQAEVMADMGPFAILLLPLSPLFLAGGIVVDTTEKMTGN